MHFLNLFLLLLFSILSYSSQSEACQYYVGAEGEGGAEADHFILARKKRDDEDRAEITKEMRDYFTACMNALLSSSEYDWRSSVDYTVLDTLWYLNTEETYCSPSGDGATPECWKEEITNYIVSDTDEILVSSQTCIDHFAEDTYAEPPTNRYESTRKKREASSTSSSSSSSISLLEELEEEESLVNLTELNDYDTCVSSSVSYTLQRQSLNFTQLSLFVAVATTDGCDRKKGNRTKMGPRFASRFVALTRPDSSLRNPLNVCQKQSFPPASFWGSWGGYSTCSVTCGEGTKKRRRGCRSGVNPKQKATDCPGRARQIMPCNRTSCSAEVYSWGEWSNFSNCSQSCGSGSKERTRSCLKRENSQLIPTGAAFCDGKDVDRLECNTDECPVSWGKWSELGQCVARKVCGKGVQMRKRECKRGKDTLPSSNCPGSSRKRKSCTKECS